MLCDKARSYVARRQAMMFIRLQGVAGDIEIVAKNKTSWKDRTGHAKQSIKAGCSILGDTIIMYVSHGARYGRYLETGTKPHIIRPKNKKALSWNGAKHPVKFVHHPGTKPYPAVLPAAENGKRIMKKTVAALWR